MLEVNRSKAREAIKSRQVEIQQEELGHFTSNLSFMSRTASILAGFTFGALTSMQRREIFEGSLVGTYYFGHNFLLRLLFVIFSVASMMLNFSAILISTYTAMLAPDLALRGPLGSMDRALVQVRMVHQWVIYLFLGGLYSFNIAVVFWSWVFFIVDGSGQFEIDSFMYIEPIAISLGITITITILTFVIQDMYYRFYHDTLQVDGRKDMFFLRAEKYNKEHEDDHIPKCYKCSSDLGEGIFCATCGANNLAKRGVLPVVEPQSTAPKVRARSPGNRVSYVELAAGKLTQWVRKGGKLIRQIDLVEGGDITINGPSNIGTFSAASSKAKIVIQAPSVDEAERWVEALRSLAPSARQSEGVASVALAGNEKQTV